MKDLTTKEQGDEGFPGSAVWRGTEAFCEAQNSPAPGHTGAGLYP